jgi:acetyltransferase (GNAT) family protein
MDIRKARLKDAEEACAVVRRSIAELSHADHQGDAATVSAWLANKTAENMRRWITQAFVFVATEALMRQLEQQAAELGVATMTLRSTVTALRFYDSAGYRSAGPSTRGFGITAGYPMTKTL